MANMSSRTVVVGIDYSEAGRLALGRALALAEGGTLHVVHAVEMLAPVAAAGLPIQIPLNDLSRESAGATLRRYVEEQVIAWEADEAPATTGVVSHLAYGAPAEEIVELAGSVDADLIVVGTHGRRGVKRFVLGSVAERVVRLSSCPVLVERPKRAAAAVPEVEPPCPRCVEARRASEGRELWCSQHRERHGRRHTYHAADASPAFPSGHGGLGSVS